MAHSVVASRWRRFRIGVSSLSADVRMSVPAFDGRTITATGPSHEHRTDSVDDAGRGRPGPLHLGSRRDPRRGHMLVSAHPGAVVGRHPRAPAAPLSPGRRRAHELELRRRNLGRRRARPRPGLDHDAAARLRTLRSRATGDAPRYLHRPEAEPPGNRFNDGKCDAQGRFWGGTMDFACEARTGALYCYAADGKLRAARQGLRRHQRPDLVARRSHDVLQRHGARPRQCLRLRADDGRAVESARMAAIRARRRSAGRHDDRCRRPAVDRPLGRRLRQLPRPARAAPSWGAWHCPRATSRIALSAGPSCGRCTSPARGPDCRPSSCGREPLAGGLFAFEVAEPGIAPALFAG